MSTMSQQSPDFDGARAVASAIDRIEDRIDGLESDLAEAHEVLARLRRRRLELLYPDPSVRAAVVSSGDDE